MICIHLLRNSDFLQRGMQPRFSWDKRMFKISIISWIYIYIYSFTFNLIVQADSLPSETLGEPSDKTYFSRAEHLATQIRPECLV